MDITLLDDQRFFLLSLYLSSVIILPRLFFSSLSSLRQPRLTTPLFLRVNVFKSGVSIARTSTKQVEQKPRETPCFT